MKRISTVTNTPGFVCNKPELVLQHDKKYVFPLCEFSDEHIHEKWDKFCKLPKKF